MPPCYICWYYLCDVYYFVHGAVQNVEGVPSGEDHIMILQHMHGWLYCVEEKHERDDALHDGLNALDTASHCDAAGCRISGRQILPYEGLCQVE